MAEFSTQQCTAHLLDFAHLAAFVLMGFSGWSKGPNRSRSICDEFGRNNQQPVKLFGSAGTVSCHGPSGCDMSQKWHDVSYILRTASS
jgi:hypothetical protein